MSTYNVMNQQKRNTHFINHIGLTPYPNPVVSTGENGKPQFFYTDDARAVDSFRGLPTLLDKPSYVGCVGIDETFSRDNSNNKFSSYDGYGDINNGQIAYYIDKSLAQPYNASTYTISGTTEKKMLVDPMGANKPQYKKTPYSTTLNAVSKYQTTRDALSHREDLMALQSRKRDQQSYVYFNMN